MGAAETTQYLTFRLDDGLYGLDIAHVREVLDLTAITGVPRMPAHMLGVINLRGSVVPVVDLRLRLDMEGAEPTVNSCIIITEVRAREETVNLGVLVDSVQEVIDLGPDELELPPNMGAGLDVDFIKGMGKHGGGFVIILRMDRIFPADCP